MHSDGHFAIGSTHTVCQDWVRTGKTEQGQSFAIVCDGCSSSPDTDVGARLLALSAEQSLRNNFLAADEVTYQALGLAVQLDLRPQCLDATLIVVASRNPAIKPGIAVSMWGDGVIAARRRDGGPPTVIQVEFPLGAPFYPNYLAFPERKAAFDALGTANSPVVTILSGTKPDALDFDFNRADGLQMSFDDDFDLVVAMSDGAATFRQGPDSSVVPVLDVAREILAVKSPVGEFMLRRCRRFLEHDCKARGWRHLDDFSVAAVHADGRAAP